VAAVLGLGVVGLAAGVRLTIGHAAQPHPAREALAIGGGTALFLAGHAAFRRALHLGRAWPRVATAVFALARPGHPPAHPPAAVGEDRACD
jgi:low temperature requirement protein LtrA